MEALHEGAEGWEGGGGGTGGGAGGAAVGRLLGRMLVGAVMMGDGGIRTSAFEAVGANCLRTAGEVVVFVRERMARGVMREDMMCEFVRGY